MARAGYLEESTVCRIRVHRGCMCMICEKKCGVECSLGLEVSCSEREDWMRIGVSGACAW